MPATPERPPIAQAPLSAVLLAHNAGPDLEAVVSAWDAYLASLARPYEIVVVNDASTDGTGPGVDKLAAALPHLRVLHHDTHLGFGAALRTGLLNARNPLVFTVPCDKQFHPPDLYRVLEPIDQVDLVAGYRVGLPLPARLRVLDGLRRLVARVLLGAVLEPRDSW